MKYLPLMSNQNMYSSSASMGTTVQPTYKPAGCDKLNSLISNYTGADEYGNCLKVCKANCPSNVDCNLACDVAIFQPPSQPNGAQSVGLVQAQNAVQSCAANTTNSTAISAKPFACQQIISKCCSDQLGGVSNPVGMEDCAVMAQNYCVSHGGTPLTQGPDWNPTTMMPTTMMPTTFNPTTMMPTTFIPGTTTLFPSGSGSNSAVRGGGAGSASVLTTPTAVIAKATGLPVWAIVLIILVLLSLGGWLYYSKSKKDGGYYYY